MATITKQMVSPGTITVVCVCGGWIQYRVTMQRSMGLPGKRYWGDDIEIMACSQRCLVKELALQLGLEATA